MPVRICDDERYDDLLMLFKAMSHPMRLAIAKMCCQKSSYAHEIEEVFDCDRTNIVKHINILKKAKVLRMEKQGRKTLYHFQAVDIKEMLECLDPDKAFVISRKTPKELAEISKSYSQK